MAKQCTMPLSEVVLFSVTNNVRLVKRKQETIQSYADSIDKLPPIVVDQRNRLLDGFHRYYAHQLVGRDRIAFRVHRVKSDAEAIEYAITSNSDHGVALSLDEIKIAANTLSELGHTNRQIAKIVKKSEHSVGRYVKEARERKKNELADKLGSLYEMRDENNKRIYTHNKLTDEIGQSEKKVSALLDHYFANEMTELLEGEDLTDEELAKRYDITMKQMERITKKYGDKLRPPVPEPEDEPEDAVEEVVETVTEEETTSEPQAQKRADAETDDDEDDEEKDEESKRKHTEIEYKLLWLGNMLGLSVWVATGDRKKSCEGMTLSEMPGMLSSLPTNIRAKVPRSVERIDILWLEKGTVVAAFEVEHSTTINSGLLRMSDMSIAMNGSHIRTNIVAPDDRLYEAKSKINSPTFRKTGLAESCRFISYTELTNKYNEAEQNGSISDDWQAFLDEIGYKL